MKNYTNQELERLKSLHRKFLDEGFSALTRDEVADLLTYLHETTQVQAKAQSGIDTAIGFEMAVRGTLEAHMKQGLTVSQASGVLSLVKTEVEMSFFLRSGGFHDVIRKAVFDTKVEGP